MYVPTGASVAGFVSQVFDDCVKGPHPQQRQLVLPLPTTDYDLLRGATLGVAGVQWWEPGGPILIKLVSRTPSAIDVASADPIPHVVVVSHDDHPRLQTLFADGIPSLGPQCQPSAPPPSNTSSAASTAAPTPVSNSNPALDTSQYVDVTKFNLGNVTAS